MQAPRFWYRPARTLAAVFSPLARLYAAGTARRLRSGARAKVAVPVICVGNINVGGTGKTPTVIALIERLRNAGLRPHVVSRGYGGRLKGPVQVRETCHSSDDVGDEPLLIAAFAPVWVARDRHAGARAAAAAGADILLLDDGFQDASLQYDLSVIVVDAARGFGNGHVIPAGPLREPVTTGLRRADMVLSIGPPAHQAQFQRDWGQHITSSHLRADLHPLSTGMDWTDTAVLAFAGIGHPERFFNTLRNLGANVVKCEALSDHQPLSEPLLTRLQRDAAALGAQLVTTEKDAVRLPPALRGSVLALPVRLRVEDWTELDAALERMSGT